RLAPLGIPQASSRLTAAEAAAFPAVQLFVERASAIVEDFALTDANAPLVVAICRKLDGLPLAIEFAAPRVEVLGVEGLAARLDDSLLLLGARRPAAMPRHQTMRAVVDWSYSLLSEDERRFFRALGPFRGAFTVDAAAAVAMDAGVRALDWAFSPGGEASTGVALTAAALPLWIGLSLLEECCRRVQQALRAASTENPREAMRLQAALGASTPEASEMVAAFTKVLDMAK